METGHVLMLIIAIILTLHISHSMRLPMEATDRTILPVKEQGVMDKASIKVTDENSIFYDGLVQEEETTTDNDYVPVVNKRTGDAKTEMVVIRFLEIIKLKRIEKVAHHHLTTGSASTIKGTTTTADPINSIIDDLIDDLNADLNEEHGRTRSDKEHRIVKRDPPQWMTKRYG